MAALIEFQLPILVVAIPMPAQGQQRHKLLPLPAAKGTTECMGRVVPTGDIASLYPISKSS